MTLIKSISGIRGTIGGLPDQGLTPLDLVKFTSGFASYLKSLHPKERKLKVLVGRDARISGSMVNRLVCGTLMGCGIDVLDAGLSTTPTVEMGVTHLQADGGIILTASHNPKQWNALKLLNASGEFLNEAEGLEVLRLSELVEAATYVEVDHLGQYAEVPDLFQMHIDKVLALPLVDVEAIRQARFKVAIDAVNSTGGMVIPSLLEALGVAVVIPIHCEPNGEFPHNPEPLPEHLRDLSECVVREQAQLGFVVDPDVDRLAIVCEDGECFGEEYTLVSVADYVIKHTPGPAVSNLSSTRALRDICEKHHCQYEAAAVGEVNVVSQMKAIEAIIGGEGNGGIIYPELHYGRDALVGIALFLSHLAHSQKTCSQLRFSYPNYFISKNKVELEAGMDVDHILKTIAQQYAKERVNQIDGVKIDFENEWVHLRKSNTEPIIRIYAESSSQVTAEYLANKIIGDIGQIIRETITQ